MDTDVPTPSPAHRSERPAELTLAALVGREFVEVLDAGLRRARAAGRRPAQPPSPPPAEPRAAVPRRQREPEPGPGPAAALLSRHAPAILRSFESALPAPGRAGQTPRRAPRLALLVWAQTVLRRAMDLAPAAVPAPPPTPEQQVFAAALLLECAAVTLPAGHPAGPEALGALARAIRAPRTGAAPERTAAVSAPVRRP
ncbi:hypothetical protein GCM10010145_23230 [Streptomyces ruber]|uniref:Uncharacterized protein n=1 Tax=Streptomyces ruber TaxID=83378 RepID=A0A918BAJ5_9ACTN|nr:hypothetical protein [Streptomyces ruber]GGQ53007.1 hypothetical protein GCM10010145_23230 [Streptomyces ruber]